MNNFEKYEYKYANPKQTKNSVKYVNSTRGHVSIKRRSKHSKAGQVHFTNVNHIKFQRNDNMKDTEKIKSKYEDWDSISPYDNKLINELINEDRALMDALQDK